MILIALLLVAAAGLQERPDPLGKIREAIREGKFSEALARIRGVRKVRGDSAELRRLERWALGVTKARVRAGDRELEVVLTPLDPETLSPTGEDLRPGRTPLVFDVKVGLYLVRLEGGEGEPIRFELRVRRDPEGKPLPVELSIERAAPRGFCLVPGGPFRFGGGPATKTNPEQNPAEIVSIPDFAIAKVEVTHGDLIRMIARVHDASLRRSLLPTTWRAGPPSRAFERLPVSGVDFHQAMILAARAGLRLPSEHEWEKAARGVFGRIYPWGNDPSGIEGLKGQLVEVEEGSNDVSPYGVRGMSSQTMEWTYSPEREDWLGLDFEPRVRGASYGERGLNDSPDYRLYFRTDFLHPPHLDYSGFRMARSFAPEDPQRGLRSPDAGVRLEAWRALAETPEDVADLLSEERSPFVLAEVVRRLGMKVNNLTGRGRVRFLAVATWLEVEGARDALWKLAEAGSREAAVQLARIGSMRALPLVSDRREEVERFVRTQGRDRAALALLSSEDPRIRKLGVRLAAGTRSFAVLAKLRELGEMELLRRRLEAMSFRGKKLGLPEEQPAGEVRAASWIAVGQYAAGAEDSTGELRCLAGLLEGKNEEACKAIESALARKASGFGYLLRAIVRLRKGDLEGAYKDVLRGKDRFSDTEERLYLDALKGVILAHQGKRRARRYLEKALHALPGHSRPFLQNLPELSRDGLWASWTRAAGGT